MNALFVVAIVWTVVEVLITIWFISESEKYIWQTDHHYRNDPPPSAPGWIFMVSFIGLTLYWGYVLA